MKLMQERDQDGCLTEKWYLDFTDEMEKTVRNTILFMVGYLKPELDAMAVLKDIEADAMKAIKGGR